MKSIVSVNSHFPTIENKLSYFSGESLRDYDIAVIDPELPSLQRIFFTGGGSCIDIDSSAELKTAMSHWAEEIRSALHAGKTVFFLLGEIEKDQIATGSQLQGKSRNYSTEALTNYQILPIRLPIKNSKGRHLKAINSGFQSYLSALGEFTRYSVVFLEKVGDPIFAAKDGSAVGAVITIPAATGHLVLIPYLNFQEFDSQNSTRWSNKAVQLSKAIVGQMFAIDKFLRGRSSGTPAPDWLEKKKFPRAVHYADQRISQIQGEIASLEARRSEEHDRKKNLQAFSRLLYENGKSLEAAIEDGLRVLGFTVENFRKGDFEIDHIIVGASGKRMIGESEGKDSSAIDISKFRQLESNINEDFEREEVELPAKGVLFGNGYRLSDPVDRPDEFTAKCMTNAKRLGTALVKTSDLYEAVIYALDNPEDESFRTQCQQAIEGANGALVVFPRAEKQVSREAGDRGVE